MNDSMLKEIATGIVNILGIDAASIILYGSFARMTATPESDVDIAVILKTKLQAATEDILSDFIVEMNLKYDRVFSVIDINEEQYRKWQSVVPFYKNIKTEGIVLWQAA